MACKKAKEKNKKEKEEEIMVKKKAHRHQWEWYDGMLGYQSRVCSKCGVDWNDLQKKKKKRR